MSKDSHDDDGDDDDDDDGGDDDGDDDDGDDDGVQVVQVFLRRQEIPVSKVERYVLPHISSLFHHHIIFNQKVTNLWLVLHAFLHFRALVICHSIFSNLFYQRNVNQSLTELHQKKKSLPT